MVVIVIAASVGYLYATSSTQGTQTTAQSTASASTQPTEWKLFSTRTFHVGCCPGYVAFDPRNGLAYVSIQPANAVYAVNPSTEQIVANISVGSYPRDVVVNPTNDMVYVANEGSNSISVISGETNEVVANITVGRYPVELAVNPKTGFVYVPDLLGYGNVSGALAVIDGSNNNVLAEVSVGCNGSCGNASNGVPNSVDVNPSTNMVYVGANGVNTLYAVNGSTNTVVGRVPVGTYPDGVAVDPSSETVYVSNLLNDTVSVVNASTMTVLSTLKVGSQPDDVAFDPVLDDVFVVNQGNDTVSVIGSQSNSVVGSVKVGPDYCLSCGVGPVGGLGVDTDSGDVYVAVSGTGNVTVISKCTSSSCPAISGRTPSCGSYAEVWTYPNSSPVLPGSRVTSSITTCTKGNGAWSISIQATNQTVAAGTFSCPCADKILFNYTAGESPLPSGNYWFQASFNGGGFGGEFDVRAS